jgi:hypothetical protein
MIAESGSDLRLRKTLLAVTSTLFDKHSVVDRGASALLDITPLDDRSYSYFLPYDGSQDEFDKLPNQVIALDI